MEITVTYSSGLSRVVGRKTEKLVLSAGTPVSDVLQTVSPDKRLSCMAVVNGRKADMDRCLTDGDELKLIPIVGAG